MFEKKSLNFAGKFASMFVKNTNLTLLVILGLFAWGVFSFIITPKEENPQIVVPVANIITTWPGATSEEVERRITVPLENSVKAIPGVEDIYSVSSHNVSIITVRFFVGEDRDISMEKLYDKLQAHRDVLPPGVEWPIVKPIDIDDVPILVVTLTSDTFDTASLKDVAEDIADTLKLPEDVAFAEVYGGLDRRISLFIDPYELEAKQLSVQEIIQAVRQNNISMPLGDVDTAKDTYILEISNYYKTIEDLGNTLITYRDDQPLYLRDIAEITDGVEERDFYVSYGENGATSTTEAVHIAVAKKKGVNAVTLSEDLIEAVEKLEATQEIPTEVQVMFTRNSGEVAEDAVSDLLTNLYQAIIIVLLVLLLFLGLREATIVAITIPLTIASVFGVGLLAGQTINRITLFALILSLGMLVDSAIVVVENISRHIKMGKESRLDATITAVNEVGFGLLASTITTVLAFYPMAFVTGMMGPYMGPIPFNTPTALITAFIVAIIITPWLATKILKKNISTPDQHKKKSKFFDVIIHNYQRLLKTAFTNKLVAGSIMGGSAFLFLLAMMFPLLPLARFTVGLPEAMHNIPGLEFKMLPKSDKNTLTVYVDMPVGTNLETTREAVGSVEEYLLSYPEVKNISTFVGTSSVPDFNGLLKGSGNRNNPHQATIQINLTHKDTRKIASKDIVTDMRYPLYEIGKKHQARIKLIEDPPGPPVRSTVLAAIYGENNDQLQNVAEEIGNVFRTTDAVVGVDDSIPENHKKLQWRINWDEAGWSHISPATVADTIRVFVDGSNIDTWHQEEERNQVNIWLGIEESKRTITDLEDISIPNMNGEFVPISTFGEYSFIEEEPPIYRENLERVSYVYGEMEERSQVYAVFEMGKEINETMKLPDNVRIEWEGEWELTKDVFRDLGIAMAIGIFMIYLVLVAQFKSFTAPIIIMVTIPLAMIGIIPGFMLVGLQFNATSMIGVIALAGIVVNNAIIMLEYINDLKKQGLGLHDSLLKATKTRIRPILLTSATTMLGSVTIALGDEVWAGLGWAIIWGMLVSTMLTLVVFPILYKYVEGRMWR